MRILVFKLSPIGDTVMFLPVVQALRTEHPDWKLTVVTTPAAAELYRGTVDESDLVITERARLQKSWRRPWELIGWMSRLWGHDAALLSFDQSSVARMLAKLSRARVRVGGAGSVVNFQGGLTHEVAHRTGQSIAEWEWEMGRALARAVGSAISGELSAPNLQSGRPAVSQSGSDLALGSTALLPDRPTGSTPRILIHPGASREYLRWGDSRFAELARRLAADFDVEVIERPFRTLAELIDRIAGVDLFVGNHSGAFHLAAAVGVRCVALTSSANFSCDPPWNRDRIRILRAPGLACQPCDRLTVSADRCTNTGEPMACMNRWTVEAVEAVCRAQLNT